MQETPIQVRSYGDPRHPPVFLLHGGPGLPGHLSGLARLLADRWFVREPLQRLSGGEPLTVARHLADLDALVGEPATLVGSSWGAMLGLCYAAEHPQRVARLALVGSGTFDALSRALLIRLRDERLGPEGVARLEALTAELVAETDAAAQDALFQAMGEVLWPAYWVDPISRDLEVLRYDYRGHVEAWNDMLRLQAEGVYPARFARIEAPVLMLHGDDDPHPGPAIHRGLAPLVRRLEYRGFPRCGHFPWLERHAQAPFLDALRAFLPPPAP